MSSLESYFLKYKRNTRIESSISGYIANFLILELESSISGNIEILFGADFFYFCEVGLKSTPGSCILWYSLNNFHSSIKFSHQTESGNKLSFLDVLLIRTGDNIEIFIFRKPTKTDIYIHWNWFAPFQ